ncbi:TPA: hypothetical protein EYP44_03195 [Candidatus Bathyarchaeota archaeon]|nr:hypothetical protein [Candidatus Bathyarchaeota archaeon]
MLVIAHGDLDGICSVAILLKRHPNAKVIFAEPRNLSEVLANVRRPELLYILDIAAMDPNVVTELKRLDDSGTKIVYLDHHSESEVVRGHVKELILDTLSSTAQICYKYVGIGFELADLGAVSDRLMMIPKLASMARTISTALRYDVRDDEFRLRLARHLSNKVSVPEEAAVKAAKVMEMTRGLMRLAKENVVAVSENVAVIDFTGHDIMGHAGYLAQRLANRWRKAIFVIFRANDSIIVTVRRQHGNAKVDLKEVLSALAKSFGGRFGGYSARASAALPKSSDLRELVSWVLTHVG